MLESRLTFKARIFSPDENPVMVETTDLNTTTIAPNLLINNFHERIKRCFNFLLISNKWFYNLPLKKIKNIFENLKSLIHVIDFSAVRVHLANTIKPVFSENPGGML